MSDLKPCPFCGGEATRQIKELGNGVKLYETGCDNKGCLTLPYSTGMDAEHADEYWNTRAPDQPQEGMPEYNGYNPGKFYDDFWKILKESDDHLRARQKLSIRNLRGIVRDAFSCMMLQNQNTRADTVETVSVAELETLFINNFFDGMEFARNAGKTEMQIRLKQLIKGLAARFPNGVRIVE